MRRRDAERERSRALIDALGAMSDTLRSGASLRQALESAAGAEASPFERVAAALRSGRPLVPTLHAAASDADEDFASACCVLAVHAEAGGDPLPACRAVAERIARRQSAADEARALTTQSRLGARTILFLTPVFLGLVVVSDPRSVGEWIRDPRIRTAIVAGLVLQALGAWWIGAIVRNAVAAGSTATGLPVVRAVRALLAGRGRSTDDGDVASCAEIVALVLDAGVSPTAALSVTAPFARGRFGDALRDAIRNTRTPIPESLDACVGTLGSPTAARFARAVRAATELGVPLAEAMRSLADEVREGERVRIAEDIRTASVRVLVPLGALVLPAFVLACLIPLFVGGLSGLAGT